MLALKHNYAHTHTQYTYLALTGTNVIDVIATVFKHKACFITEAVGRKSEAGWEDCGIATVIETRIHT